MPRAPRLAPCLLLLLVAGCGPHGETGIPEGQTKPWAQMDEDERMQHMAAVVQPRLKAVFQAHDPERFADFGCATCHGSGGGFEMPNPGLPELDASKLYKAHRTNPDQKDLLRVMWKEVEPAMGEALAVTYGFGGEIECASCHVVHNQKE